MSATKSRNPHTFLSSKSQKNYIAPQITPAWKGYTRSFLMERTASKPPTTPICNQKSQPSYVSFEQIPEKLYSPPNNASGERLHPEFPYGEDSLETTDNSQNPTNQLTPAPLSPQTSSDSTDNPIETEARLSPRPTPLPADTEFQTLSPANAPP